MPGLAHISLDIARWERTALNLLDRYTEIPPLVHQTSLSSSMVTWQHPWVSFRISRHEQRDFDFRRLVSVYLDPAVRSLARNIDGTILSTAYSIIRNRDRTPYLPPLTEDNCRDNLCATRRILNNHLAPMDHRNLILSPQGERVLWTSVGGAQRLFGFNVCVNLIISDFAQSLAWQRNAISYAANPSLRIEVEHDDLLVIFEADIEIDVPNPGWIMLFQEQP